MTFEEFLTENGHYKAENRLAEIRRLREAHAHDWPEAYAAGKTEGYKTLAEFDEHIALCEHAIAVTYDQLVKSFDAKNDLDFAALKLEEGLRLIFEEVEKKNPEAAKKLDQFLQDMSNAAPDKPKD